MKKLYAEHLAAQALSARMHKAAHSPVAMWVLGEQDAAQRTAAAKLNALSCLAKGVALLCNHPDATLRSDVARMILFAGLQEPKVLAACAEVVGGLLRKQLKCRRKLVLGQEREDVQVISDRLLELAKALKEEQR